MRKYSVAKLLLASAIALPFSAFAKDAGSVENFPNRQMKIIVPVSPGGTADSIARLIGERLQKKWGQVVVVENRAGASGSIGADAVYRADPDGYTLLLSPPGPLVINKSLYSKLSYDSDQFVPVSVIAANPNVLLVNPKVPVKTLQEFIAYAKANPGKINYSSGGTGSTPHLAGESLKMLAGINIVHIPYKGGPPAYTDLMSGTVDMMFQGLATALPQIQDGTLRALAIGGDKRYPALPNLPTVGEVLPSFISVSWTGLVAPPKTPPAIVAKISSAIAQAFKQDDIGTQLNGIDARDLILNTPAQAAEYMHEEKERWSNVIRKTGTHVD
mgnify:CR=1 FL=1